VSGHRLTCFETLPVDARAVRAAQIFNRGCEPAGSARALANRGGGNAQIAVCERPSTILPVAGTKQLVYPPSQIAKRRACVLERRSGATWEVSCPRSRRPGHVVLALSKKMPRHSQASVLRGSCEYRISALSKDTARPADPPSNPNVCVSATEGVMSIGGTSKRRALEILPVLLWHLAAERLSVGSACAAFFAWGLRRAARRWWTITEPSIPPGPERPKARASVAQAAGDDSNSHDAALKSARASPTPASADAGTLADSADTLHYETFKERRPNPRGGGFAISAQFKGALPTCAAATTRWSGRKAARGREDPEELRAELDELEVTLTPVSLHTDFNGQSSDSKQAPPETYYVTLSARRRISAPGAAHRWRRKTVRR